MALVFVTHDLAAARYVADRIAVMYLGRIVETGDAAAVTSAPQHPYTAALLSSVPSLGARPAPMRGEAASPTRVPSGCAFHTRCSRAGDTCDVADPLLEPMGDGHRVACWFPGADPTITPQEGTRQTC
jgi:oligopeptide/dipeptide ABC transporter ATP-binding protein